MRRTAAFLCLGLAIFAAVIPGAVIATPLLSGGAGAVAGARGIRATGVTDDLCSPLLTRITPRHLPRASLSSFAA